MSLIFNGTTISKVIKDGTEIRSLKFGNTEVFKSYKLTINFIGLNYAIYSTYPFIVRSTNVSATQIYGSSNKVVITIPANDTVTFDFSKYIQFANLNPDTDDDWWSGSIKYYVSSSESYTYGFLNDYGSKTFTFTMDKDITLNYVSNNYGTFMGKLVRTSSNYTNAYFQAQFNAIPTNPSGGDYVIHST